MRKAARSTNDNIEAAKAVVEKSWPNITKTRQKTISPL
jgi:hypothetical protein